MRLIGLVLALGLTLASRRGGLARRRSGAGRVERPRPSSRSSQSAPSRPRIRGGSQRRDRVALCQRKVGESSSDGAADLVRLRVEAIVASTSPSIKAAQKATTTIPIVMSTVGDPIEGGFVLSFARPGGNITGRTTQAPELMGERIQLLKEAVPRRGVRLR